MSEGKKYDDGKLDWTILPYESLEYVVRVLEHGEKKYSRTNWKSVKPKERYLRAAFRHLIAYTQGEKRDAESNITPLAHCIADLLFLIYLDKEQEDDKISES